MPAAAKKRDPEQELREAMAAFAHDPVGFVYFAFPWGEPNTELASESGPRDWQIDVLQDIADQLTAGDIAGAIRIAVASGHGIGKSALVSWIICWAIATFPQTKVVITANTGDQLRTKTWPEVSKWFNLLICRHWFALEATSIRARGNLSTYADDSVKKARDDQKKRAAAMAGYASPIATGGQGVATPASTTAGKTMLGA